MIVHEIDAMSQTWHGQREAEPWLWKTGMTRGQLSTCSTGRIDDIDTAGFDVHSPRGKGGKGSGEGGGSEGA